MKYINRIKEYENLKISDQTREFLGRPKIKTDKQVAKLLKLSSQSLTNYKSRKVIPYKAIVNYCITNKVAIDWILMEDVWKEEI